MRTLSVLRPYVAWWSVLAVLAVVAANVVLPIVVYNAVASQQNDNLIVAFNVESARTLNDVQSQLARTQRAVQNLRVAVFFAEGNLTSSQFSTSVSLINRVDAITTIAWIPYVTDAAAFQQHVRAINANDSTANSATAKALANFTVTQLYNSTLPGNLTLVPASGRPAYFPILYAWPNISQIAVGFDIGTLPAVFGRVGNVIDTGVPSVFTNVRSPGDPARRQGILFYYPVYRGGTVPGTAQERRSGALGLLASSAQLHTIIDSALGSGGRVRVFIFDGGGRALFGSSLVGGGPASVEPVRNARYEAPLVVADAQWTFVAVPTETLVADETSNSPAVFAAITAVGIFILLLVVLFGIYHIVRARMRTEESELRRKRATAMIGYVNHEIRNPLQGVMGLVEHAMMEAQGALHSPNPSKDDMIGAVVSDLRDTTQMCDLMHHIVNDVLDIRSLEEGRLAIKTEATDVDKLVNDVVAIVQPKLSEKQQLTLEVVPRPIERGPRNLVAECDPARMKQVLLNLLTNAIKFSDSGTIQVSVDVVAGNGTVANQGQPRGEQLHIAVKDCGHGIPPDKHKLVFSPFTHQLGRPGAGRHQGAGLGLYLCSMLVEAMGGKIGFSSTPGVGSTFWFDVPYVPKALIDIGSYSDVSEGPATKLQEVVVVEPTAAAVATVQRVPPDESMELQANGGVGARQDASEQTAGEPAGGDNRAMRRHLVCDDVRINRVVLRRYLESFGTGVDVAEAENGQRAIELAAQHPYDVIWMDIRMPFVDGIEATKAIRAAAEGLNKDTPVVGVTGDVTAEETAHYRQAGMQVVMSKPVKRQDIARVLRALAGQQLRQ